MFRSNSIYSTVTRPIKHFFRTWPQSILQHSRMFIFHSQIPAILTVNFNILVTVDVNIEIYVVFLFVFQENWN